MEFFRKGGGGVTQSITFEAHFCASRVKVFLFKIEGFGHFWALFSNRFGQYGHFACFWEVIFSPFLVTKTQMCLTASITSENKGGGG